MSFYDSGWSLGSNLAPGMPDSNNDYQAFAGQIQQGGTYLIHEVSDIQRLQLLVTVDPGAEVAVIAFLSDLDPAMYNGEGGIPVDAMVQIERPDLQGRVFIDAEMELEEGLSTYLYVALITSALADDLDNRVTSEVSEFATDESWTITPAPNRTHLHGGAFARLMDLVNEVNPEADVNLLTEDNIELSNMASIEGVRNTSIVMTATEASPWEHGSQVTLEYARLDFADIFGGETGTGLEFDVDLSQGLPDLITRVNAISGLALATEDFANDFDFSELDFDEETGIAEVTVTANPNSLLYQGQATLQITAMEAPKRSLADVIQVTELNGLVLDLGGGEQLPIAFTSFPPGSANGFILRDSSWQSEDANVISQVIDGFVNAEGTPPDVGARILQLITPEDNNVVYDAETLGAPELPIGFSSTGYGADPVSGRFAVLLMDDSELWGTTEGLSAGTEYIALIEFLNDQGDNVGTYYGTITFQAGW